MLTDALSGARLHRELERSLVRLPAGACVQRLAWSSDGSILTAAMEVTLETHQWRCISLEGPKRHLFERGSLPSDERSAGNDRGVR